MQSSECETCGSSVGGLVVVATGYEVRHGRGVLAVGSQQRLGGDGSAESAKTTAGDDGADDNRRCLGGCAAATMPPGPLTALALLSAAELPTPAFLGLGPQDRDHESQESIRIPGFECQQPIASTVAAAQLVSS
jgi:hypothetical protein